MALLVSTKIIFEYAAKTAVACDWRVVMIPEDGYSDVTFIDLYQNILNHTFDPLEPFVLSEELSIRVQIGKEQAGKFQEIPITVKVADAISTFGVYIKYFVQCEEAQGPSVSVANPRRNAFEVR